MLHAAVGLETEEGKCEGYSDIRVRTDGENIRNGPLRNEFAQRII